MNKTSFRLFARMRELLSGQSLRSSILTSVLLLVCVPIALAARPANIWSAPGMQKGFFSRDGAWAILTGRSSAGGRIEVRTATTGTLLRAITNQIGFDSVALTRDELTIATARAS